MYRKIFSYRKIESINRKYIERKIEYDILELSWPAEFKTPFDNNNTAYAIHYMPKLNRRNRSIILIPGLHSSANFERGVARGLAKSGFDAFVYILPYHMMRTPKGYSNGAIYLSTQFELSGGAFLQTVKETRALADITPGEEKGLFGISLGGIISHILMGIDNRFTAGVTVSSGGNINRVLWTGLIGWAIKRELKRRGATERDYINIQKRFKSFLDDVRKGNWRKPDYPWFLFDPLTYAHLNHPRNILMFNGLFDLVIPLKSILELKNALGCRNFVILPSGHLTMLPFSIYIYFYLRDFFINWDDKIKN